MDSGACESATAGLCLVPKLKYEHIYLTKMRVDLAAQVATLSYAQLRLLANSYFDQVMSETVSKALRKMFGGYAEGTAKLIEIVDHLFDCLNARNLDEAKLKRKPFRSPYRTGTDWRLKVKNLVLNLANNHELF